MSIVNGFVIKSVDFADNDKIITFFSAEHGKLNIFAPGVQKITSKNKYSVDLFSNSTLDIFRSRRNKLSKLKTGYLKKTYNNIANNYQNYIYASVIADSTDQLFQDNDKSFKYYKLLEFFFEQLGLNAFPFKTMVITLFKSLKFANADWKLDRCLVDNKKVFNPRFFDPSNYGIICDEHYSGLQDKRNIFENPSLIYEIQQLQKTVINELGLAELSIENAMVLLKIMFNYYEDIIGIWSSSFRELKRLPFLQ